jgi:hypothetical protein
MLHPKSKIGILVLSIIMFAQCQNRVNYDAKEMYKIRLQSMLKSQSIVGEKEYWQIYKNINDSIGMWVSNKLNLKTLDEIGEYRIDSVICINKKANKLRAFILSRCLISCSQDYIEYLNGVKIEKKWYFFHGARLVLPRELYQKDIHKPLTWEMMEQIAADQLYSGYLKQDGNIDNRFFHDLTSVAWGKASTQAAWDSIYLEIIKENWKKKD